MYRNVKLATKLTVTIAVVTAISMLLLFLFTYNNFSKAMVENSNNNMATALKAKTQIIDEYINKAEETLTAYSRAGEVRDLLEHPNDLKIQKKAQKYTEEFYNDLEDWEGIYTAEMDTHVIAHNNPNAVGVRTREGESLKQLQTQLESVKGSLYNTGIIPSPVSDLYVLSMYRPVLSESGDIIGYVGGGPYAKGLKKTLDRIPITGLENASYVMADVNTEYYIFHNEERKIATEVDNKSFLKLMKNVKEKQEDQIGTIVYTGEDGNTYHAVYKYIAKRGWVVILSDSEAEIYAKVTESMKVLVVICVVVLILIIVLSRILIVLNLKPLTRVLGTIDKLKQLNLKESENFTTYLDNKSEVGQIATATHSLSSSLHDIIETLQSCSVIMQDCFQTTNSTSKDLMDCVENSVATTEELSASILSTNAAIEAVYEEIEHITEIIEMVEQKIETGNTESGVLI